MEFELKSWLVCRDGGRRYGTELAPKFWAATCATLDPAELAQEIGHLTVPPAKWQHPPRLFPVLVIHGLNVP